MFDISFTELMAISVVALLVIGPEKLPKVARMAGAFTGRIQKMVSQVKEEVNREVRFEELQQLQQEMAAAGADVTQGIQQEADELQSIVDDIDEHLDERQVQQAHSVKKPASRSSAKTKKAPNKKTTTTKKTTAATKASTTKTTKTRATTAKAASTKSATKKTTRKQTTTKKTTANKTSTATKAKTQPTARKSAVAKKGEAE